MRLVATEYLSLDGVFEEPGQWSFPYFNEQAMQFKSRELDATGILYVVVIFCFLGELTSQVLLRNTGCPL